MLLPQPLFLQRRQVNTELFTSHFHLLGALDEEENALGQLRDLLCLRFRDLAVVKTELLEDGLPSQSLEEGHAAGGVGGAVEQDRESVLQHLPFTLSASLNQA